MRFIYIYNLGFSHEESRKASLHTIASCPETVLSPLNITLPPLECWALEANCYCFLPTVILTEKGKPIYVNPSLNYSHGFSGTHPENFFVDWIEAQSICLSLQMTMVAIETQSEDKLIGDFILSQGIDGLYSAMIHSHQVYQLFSQ